MKVRLELFTNISKTLSSIENILLFGHFYNSTNLRFRDIYVSANNNKPTAFTWLVQGAHSRQTAAWKLIQPDMGKKFTRPKVYNKYTSPKYKTDTMTEPKIISGAK